MKLPLTRTPNLRYTFFPSNLGLLAGIATLFAASAPGTLAYNETYTTTPNGSGSVTCTDTNPDGSPCTWTLGGVIATQPDAPDYAYDPSGVTWKLSPYGGSWTANGIGMPSGQYFGKPVLVVIKGSNNIAASGIQVSVAAKITYTTPFRAGRNLTSVGIDLGPMPETIPPGAVITTSEDFSAFDFDIETSVWPQFEVYTVISKTTYAATTPEL